MQYQSSAQSGSSQQVLVVWFTLRAVYARCSDATDNTGAKCQRIMNAGSLTIITAEAMLLPRMPAVLRYTSVWATSAPLGLHVKFCCDAAVCTTKRRP